MTRPVLIPVLGDQLTRTLSSLRGPTRDGSVILMMEVWDEATYVKHHKQKIALIFSAMRHFAAELRDAGWTVDYIALGDDDNSGSFTGEVARAIERHDPQEIRVTEAGEWRVQEAIEEWPDKFDCPVKILPDDRYVCSRAEFDDWAADRKTHRMEFFYREMRKKTGLLMTDGDKPEGGQWNYDAENRKPPREGLSAPERPLFEPDDITAECIALVEDRFGDHFGTLESFAWPVTAAQAEEAADAFFAERLGKFGDYQDAMVFGNDQLFHSMISTSLNLGLLDPLALCRRAEERISRRPRAAERGGGLHPPDHRLARICARLLLALHARPEDRQRAGRAPPAARILLDRRNRHAVPRRLRALHPRQCPRPPYPAADGAGQFRADRRAGPAGGAGLVPGGLCRRL